MLSTLSFLIFTFTDLPEQQEWIKTKFADFNVFVLKAFEMKNEPDLMKHFVNVQMKVCEKYTEYYLNMPQFGVLMDAFYQNFGYNHSIPDVERNSFAFTSDFWQS